MAVGRGAITGTRLGGGAGTASPDAPEKQQPLTPSQAQTTTADRTPGE
jgi:hypothetical protein